MTGIFDSDDNSIISESSDESRGQGVESFLPSIDISCPSIQDFAGMITRAASSAVNKCLGGRKPQPRHDQVDRNTTDQGNYTRLVPGDVHQESTITASVQSPDESTDLSVQGLLADGNNAEHRNDGQEGGTEGNDGPSGRKDNVRDGGRTPWNHLQAFCSVLLSTICMDLVLASPSREYHM